MGGDENVVKLGNNERGQVDCWLVSYEHFDHA